MDNFLLMFLVSRRVKMICYVYITFLWIYFPSTSSLFCGKRKFSSLSPEPALDALTMFTVCDFSVGRSSVSLFHQPDSRADDTTTPIRKDSQLVLFITSRERRRGLKNDWAPKKREVIGRENLNILTKKKKRKKISFHVEWQQTIFRQCSLNCALKLLLSKSSIIQQPQWRKIWINLLDISSGAHSMGIAEEKYLTWKEKWAAIHHPLKVRRTDTQRPEKREPPAECSRASWR